MSDNENLEKIHREYVELNREFDTVMMWIGKMISSCNFLELSYQLLLVHLLQCRQRESAVIVSQEHRRFQTLTELVERLFVLYISDAAACEELKQIGIEANNLYRKRNPIVHSSWFYGESPVTRYKHQKNPRLIGVEASELAALAGQFDDCRQRLSVIMDKLFDQLYGSPPEDATS